MSIWLTKDERKRSEKLREKSILYRRVFGTPEGKEVLFDLINNNFVLSGHGGDVKREGRREAILDIVHLFGVNPDSFITLVETGEMKNDVVG